MRKIYFLWATIRPGMMLDTYNEWMRKCTHPENVCMKVAVSTYDQKSIIDNFNLNNTDVIVVNDKKGYNHAITVLTTQLETDDDAILLLLSDDFFPPDKWDLYLNEKFSDFDGALFLWDGYQLLVKEGALCITLACLTFSCLKKLNKIVFHPDYNHFFSDNEAFVNLNTLGLLRDDRDIDNVIFEHRHYIVGKRQQDEHDLRNYSFWEQDHQTYDDRMKMTIEERLRTNG